MRAVRLTSSLLYDCMRTPCSAISSSHQTMLMWSLPSLPFLPSTRPLDPQPRPSTQALPALSPEALLDTRVYLRMEGV